MSSSPRSLGSRRDSDPAENQNDDQALDLDLNDDGVSQVEETQFADMEIDTKATESYDCHDLHAAQQPIHNQQPLIGLSRQFVLDDEDDAAPLAFTFGKAPRKTPAMGLPRTVGGQTPRPRNDSTLKKNVISSNAPKMAPAQTMGDAIEVDNELAIKKAVSASAPQPMRRQPLANNDRNRQLSTPSQNRAEHNNTPRSKTMPGAANAAGSERNLHQSSHEIVATQLFEPMLPPFTQAAQETSLRKVRRKKAAPNALHYGTGPQPQQQHHQNDVGEGRLPDASDSNGQHAIQESLTRDFTEANDIQVHPANTNFNMSSTLPAEEQLGLRHATVSQSIDTSFRAPQHIQSFNSTTSVPQQRGSQTYASHGLPAEGAFIPGHGNGPWQIPSQPRPAARTLASLPFPEAATASSRRSSPKLTNRPLLNGELQPAITSVLGPTNPTGRVGKRKRSAASSNVTSKPTTQSTMAETRTETGRRVSNAQEEHVINHVGPAARQEQATRSDQAGPVRPLSTVTHVLSPADASGADFSPFDFIDRAKNMMVAQVHQKDRELEHLQSEVNRLEQTVEVLEGNVTKLEGDKAKLRGIMQKKCSSLQEKVGELLKDHQAVGHFVEKTSSDIAKFNKYREKSGSVFKTAISNYSDLQLHQKRTMEAIRETRLRVANDIADITRTHERESSIVLRDLQAEKKKVSELEKVLNEEKLNVKHLEARLDAGVSKEIKSMLEKQSETFAAKVDSHETGLLQAIDAKQEERAASLKDYLKTLEAYKDHETEASKSIGELLNQITTLSANVSEALKSKDETLQGLQSAGTEILNTIKEKVESMAEAQDHQAELSNRVILLETSKINLDSLLKCGEKAKAELETQLNANSLQIQQNLGQLRLKDEQIQALQLSLEQGAATAQQEADGLRSTLATLSDETQKLKEINVKLTEEKVNLQMQVSRLKDESESASDRLGTLEESTQKTSERLKACEDEKARVFTRAQAAETRLAELQSKFSEHASNAKQQLAEQANYAKQQLEAQRTKMEEERTRAVIQGKQDAVAALATLKKLHEIVKAENQKLKDTITIDAEKDELRAEIYRVQKANSDMQQRYGRAAISQGSEIQSIKRFLQESAEHLARQDEQVKQFATLEQRFMDGYEKMEARLVHHEDVDRDIRAHCQNQGWDYDEMDVSSFLQRITEKAVEQYRQSLHTSSFTADFPRPSITFSQSMTVAAVAESPTQHSQSSVSRHRAEQRHETVQVPGTQTPRRNQRSPSLPATAGRPPYAAMASPPKARRNLIIAERRRSQTSAAKPPVPDTSGTPVRKPSDRTTGSGGRPSNRLGPSFSTSTAAEVPASVKEQSQKRAPVANEAPTKRPAQAGSTPPQVKRTVDSDFSDLTDIVDMMDQNPEVDVIPVLEQQRRQRASSVAEDSQSQGGKYTTMDPPATPRETRGAPAQEPRPLKSILKKRTASMASQAEDTPVQAPPRKQLQPVKGKNSLASLGRGVVGFRSSQEAAPSRAVGFSATQQANAGEDTPDPTQIPQGRPANTSTGRVMKRMQTVRSVAAEAETQTAPKKPRLSIPYKRPLTQRN